MHICINIYENEQQQHPSVALVVKATMLLAIIS
jgi:hypothetical protein